MTRVELKDYLENIYNVPVAAIRTRIQHGEPEVLGFLLEVVLNSFCQIAFFPPQFLETCYLKHLLFIINLCIPVQ